MNQVSKFTLVMRFQDMRMKFEADEPDAQRKGGEGVDRSQGAARAISVSID
jgi:L-lactate dehydrogenase (cytochrome)